MSDNVIRAFSADHAMRVTGLTHAQLRYWDRTTFFQPAYASLGEGLKPVRLYSLRDLIGLKVLHVLRSKMKVSLAKLRKAAKTLSEYSTAPWAELRILVSQGEVAFIEPTTGKAITISGQYVMLPIIDIIREVERSIASLNERGEADIGHGTRSRNIVHNATVFSGTRVPIRAVKRFIEAGYTVEAILKEYPSIERADVEAVMANSSALAA